MRKINIFFSVFLFFNSALASKPIQGKKWSDFSKEYSNRPEMKKLTEALNTGISQVLGPKGQVKKIKKPKTFFSGYCYRYVKKALLTSGLASRYLKGAKAYEADNGPLTKEGFTNILKDKTLRPLIETVGDLPNGTILVYSGGKAGHIEVKTRFGFISDSISARPVIGSPEKRCGKCKSKFSGRNRHLVGAYLLSGPIQRFKKPAPTKLAKNI
jgi:hypothetical protein